MIFHLLLNTRYRHINPLLKSLYKDMQSFFLHSALITYFVYSPFISDRYSSSQLVLVLAKSYVILLEMQINYFIPIC